MDYCIYCKRFAIIIKDRVCLRCKDIERSKLLNLDKKYKDNIDGKDRAKRRD